MVCQWFLYYPSYAYRISFVSIACFSSAWINDAWTQIAIFTWLDVHGLGMKYCTVQLTNSKLLHSVSRMSIVENSAFVFSLMFACVVNSFPYPISSHLAKTLASYANKGQNLVCLAQRLWAFMSSFSKSFFTVTFVHTRTSHSEIM